MIEGNTHENQYESLHLECTLSECSGKKKVEMPAVLHDVLHAHRGK